MDQASGLRELLGKNSDTDSQSPVKTRVITVTSGKGGVGKTTISINLALAVAKSGKKVLLFDADLGLANINVLLGVIPKYNLYHVIKGHKTLQEIILHTPEGIDIIAGASGYSSLADLDEKERDRLIAGFEEIHGYDYVFIDTSAGIGANVVDFTHPADEIIVVTTPEPTSITDAYGIIKSIVMVVPDKNIKLLVNRANSSIEGRKVAERVINISNQFLNVRVENGGFIYADDGVLRSIRNQKPFYISYPNGKAASCINMVAAKLFKEEGFITPSTGLGGYFKKIFSRNEKINAG